MSKKSKPVKPAKKTAPPRLVGVRIDIETKSGADVTQVGAYLHSEDPDFEPLVISYAPIREYAGGARKIGTPRTLDQTEQSSVDRFAEILTNPKYEKHAFNANFERVCLSRWLGMGTGEYIDPENWRCTAVLANVHGVFGSLDDVAKNLRSPVKKDREGRRLISLFSKPDKKTGRFHRFVEEGEPFEGRHCWCGIDHDKDSTKFRGYCEQDVLTEAGVAALLPPIPEEIQFQYELDQRINDRGIRHQKKIAVAAVEQVKAEQDRLMGELKVLTGVANPNSVQQMQAWLEAQDYPMSSLDKASREEALDDPETPSLVKRALELKGAASLTSGAKHVAALKTRSEDGRIRGSLQFYGAHTGREAGRGIQPQNLPRYEAPAKDLKRLIKGKAGRDAPEIAKGTVRASLIPAKGHQFVVFDYNAIEARVLGWLAGEKWVQDEFIKGPGKIYEATAATMFGVDKDQLLAALSLCGKCGACPACSTRGKGKVSQLALGFNGGPGALVVMGAEKEGIDVGNFNELHKEWEAAGMPVKFHEWERDRHDYPELIRLRDLFRGSSPATVGFWKQSANAWDIAALSGKPAVYGQDGVVKMLRDGRHNRMVLPSGRSIWYRFARSYPDPDRPDRIERRTYIGKSKGVGHTRVDTFGGKLTENVTQAVARDLLFDLMEKVEAMTQSGWPGRIVLHVHDEVVLEVRDKHVDRVCEDMADLMSTAPDWAPGLAVKGEGKAMPRYSK